MIWYRIHSISNFKLEHLKYTEKMGLEYKKMEFRSKAITPLHGTN